MQALRCGIGVLEFWALTPRETVLAIEAALWRDEHAQRQQVAASWRTAALMRAKKLPSLRKLLADRPAKPLSGRELERRRREFEQAGAGVDVNAIAAKLRKSAGPLKRD